MAPKKSRGFINKFTDTQLLRYWMTSKDPEVIALVSRLRAAEKVIAVLANSKDLKNFKWFDEAWIRFRQWRVSKGESPDGKL